MKGRAANRTGCLGERGATEETSPKDKGERTSIPDSSHKNSVPITYQP